MGMDTDALGNDVHNINILTVIASESYDSFAKGLQAEMAEAIANRPRAVTIELFVGKVIKDDQGNEQVIDQDTASAIHYDMIVNGYDVAMSANASVKYDLIGKLVEETGLTRKAIVTILKGIEPSVFQQFKDNIPLGEHN